MLHVHAECALTQAWKHTVPLAHLLTLSFPLALSLFLSATLVCHSHSLPPHLPQVTTIFNESTAGLNLHSKQWQPLDGKRQQAQATVGETSAEWQQLHLRVHMFTACALFNLRALPDKLNPLVRPLMEAAKREENTLVQGYAASFIAKLLRQCAGRQPCPNPKILKNLCASVCVDPLLTPSSACPVPATLEAAKGEDHTHTHLMVSCPQQMILSVSPHPGRV